MNSRCTLYKSTTEEVSIWGWPLQTAGLLTAGFSSRSLTILSGRVTEVHPNFLLECNQFRDFSRLSNTKHASDNFVFVNFCYFVSPNTREISFQSLYELEFVNSTWQWSDGKLSYSTRNASETWVQQKWSASVVQLDPNTWIIEYRRTGAVENSRIVSAVLEFLKFRLSREVKRMKQEFWLFPAFGNQYDDFTRDSFKVPT